MEQDNGLLLLAVKNGVPQNSSEIHPDDNQESTCPTEMIFLNDVMKKFFESVEKNLDHETLTRKKMFKIY